MTSLACVIAVPRAGMTASLRTVTAPAEVIADGPRIWNGMGGPAISLDGAGHVAGLLFDRSSGRQAFALEDEQAARKDPIALGKKLIRQCWGAWAALLHDPATGQCQVLRDPSGLLPLYRAETASHILFATEVGLLREAADLTCRVSWPGLRAHLMWSELCQRQTALDGVTEIPPGILCPVNGLTHGIALWDPWDHVRCGQGTFEDMTARLRETVCTTVSAWAGVMGPVGVAASGGLDSSIVAAALAAGRHPFGCVTLATADPSGDERRWVRILTKALGAPAIENIYDPARVDLTSATSAGLPRPVRKAFMQETRRAFIEAARELGAAAVFDGTGGDNVFCYLHSSAPIRDRLRADGLGRGVARTLLDMCRITDCDVLTMAKAVWRARRGNPEPHRWLPDRRLLAVDDGECAVPEPLVSWLAEPHPQLPGKVGHLALLMAAQNSIKGFGETADPLQFSPLLSQPIIEQCLAIPTWHWCHGGINRSVARAAFAADLSPAITARTSKAGPDSLTLAVFARNRALIRELLLDGLLTANGIVDRGAVEEALTCDTVREDTSAYRLLDLVDAETWARSWT